MKQTWIEQRKQTALKEFEIAREELQARQARTRNPMERSMISGALALLEQGIQGVTSPESPATPWLRGLVGLLGSVANPVTESGYRRVGRVLRQFDIAEIQSTPEEVIESLPQWEGDEDVGVFALRAAWHAAALAQLVDREYVKDLLEIVRDIAGGRRDPTAVPGETDSAPRWEQLADAIATAGNAYDLLEWECNKAASTTGLSDLSQLERAAEQAALARRYLWEARETMVAKREEARDQRSTGGLETEEWSLIGRDLYHNRIRKENSLEKGQFVVIDVMSGDFEVGDNEHEARNRLRERRPDARTWLEMVGYPTPSRIGQRAMARTL